MNNLCIQLVSYLNNSINTSMKTIKIFQLGKSVFDKLARIDSLMHWKHGLVQWLAYPEV